MRSRVAIVVIASLITGVAAGAQTPLPERPSAIASRFLDPDGGLTLEDAIVQALAEEPSLRAARSEVDVARGMRRQAALRPNPTMSVDQQTEPAGTDGQTRVEVRWPLDLFRKTGRVSVADREVEATEHAIADRERLLAADVRFKYGEVAAIIREVSVSDDLVEATAQQYRLVSARVDEGATPSLDRDMLRVEWQRLEADRVLQAGRAERALIELKRLLGLAPDAPVRLRDDLDQLVRREAALPPPAEDPSVTARPDIEEAEARIQIAEAQIERARRDGRIDMSIVGMYMRSDAGFPQRGFGADNDLERVRGVFHNLSGGVMVTMPVRDRRQGEIAAAEALRAGAAAQLDATRANALAEIAAARTRDEHARRAAAAYSSEVRGLAKQNLVVVSQTYELGRMTLLDVLAEQRRYLEIERAYTSALREAYEARQALRRALGEVR